METEGLFAPATAAEAREQYEAVGRAAQEVVREVAKGLDLPPEEYRERVDEDVVLTAREAIYASLLEVHVGSREAYEDWLDGRDREVTEVGSDNVSRVAWHEAPVADQVVAATFESEPEAAVATLRRQAFGRVYREVV
jgi:hypothetical protein